MAREQPPVSNGAEGATQAIRRISVVAPLLNEASHVDGLVADLAGRTSRGVGGLVADGGSSDGSVARLRAAAEQHGLPVTSSTTRSAGSRTGSTLHRRARGDLIVRVDCHARYPPTTPPLRDCVGGNRRGNVGGVVMPTGERRWSEPSRARWTARSAASAGRGIDGAGRVRWTPSPTARSGPRRSSGQGCSTRRCSATRTTSSTCVSGDRAGPDRPRSRRSGRSTCRAERFAGCSASTTSTDSGRSR